MPEVHNRDHDPRPVSAVIAAMVSLVVVNAAILGAQAPLRVATNPLDELRDQVKLALTEAGLPFTEEQERAITLMTEDRRQASEELFGQTMDFRGGPVQGQQMDRALAAIEWMETEFTRRLGEYLSPDQLGAWETYRATHKREADETNGGNGNGGGAITVTNARPAAQTQFIRINNNPFTAEDGFFGGRGGGPGGGGPGGGGPGGGGPGGGGGNFFGGGGGGFGGGGDRGPGGGGPGGGGGRGRGGTEVIERGGTGAFHGQGSFNLQDEALNARNPFAGNKPPYQERQISGNFSGPIIRNRLTANFFGSHNEAQNVDTVHATTPDGLFELGIVRPNINRNASVRGTYQLTGAHSLIFNARYGTNEQRNNGVGGFSLPERASQQNSNFANLEFRQFSVFSPRLLFETAFQMSRSRRGNRPASDAVAVNVLDAFRAGGAGDRSQNRGLDYTFGSLVTRMGPVWTIKAGLDGQYRTNDDFSSNNFNGTYTFSSLNDYVAGTAVLYRVTRGTPLIVLNQFEMSSFMQNDIRLTPRFTLMVGLRHEWQTNLDDHNNVAPRASLAWAIGPSLVVRGGTGIFYSRIFDDMIMRQLRLDGTRQYEIVINNPTWPDPFQSQDVTIKLPTSVRETDPSLVAPFRFVSQVAIEKTFRNNLFVSATYDRTRGLSQLRTLNINAPRPGETTNPDPGRGNVLKLFSDARSTDQNLRFSARQRFSIFNVSASYGTGSSYNSVDRWEDPPANSYDPAADWGRSGFRPPYNFNATVNAQLPLEFFLTGSLFRSGGQPYNITTGKDDNNDGQTNDRPAGIARNSEDGPGFSSWNFSISKAVFFGTRGRGGSGTNVNVFANMNNAFNRTNFGTPSGVMTSPYFRRSYSARNPREIEVGIRFNF